MGELVYEMLWDCQYCDARKLLGLTHRHCPNCGAAQAANARYFPQDSEKVAVQNHEFVGADVACRYCAFASSKRAKNCGRCGASLAEGTGVPSQTVPGVAQALVGSAPPVPPARPAWKLWLPVLALLLVSATAVGVLWKKDRTFVVAACRWQRTIDIEHPETVSESAWCSDVPAGAKQVARHQERRGSRQVPDGESCHTQKQDRGDGTFKEEQVCQPKYKEEPTYDDKCTFQVLKQVVGRQERAEGDAAQPPSWPSVTLAATSNENRAPYEREGARREQYTVELKDDQGASYSCEFPQEYWAKFRAGQRYPGKLRALVGTLDCSSLVSAR